jgi:hypothetical protein
MDSLFARLKPDSEVSQDVPVGYIGRIKNIGEKILLEFPNGYFNWYNHEDVIIDTDNYNISPCSDTELIFTE